MKSRPSNVWKDWATAHKLPMETTRTPTQYVKEVCVDLTEVFWKALAQASKYPILFCEIFRKIPNRYGVQVYYKYKGKIRVYYDDFPATPKQFLDTTYIRMIALKFALELGS